MILTFLYIVVLYLIWNNIICQQRKQLVVIILFLYLLSTLLDLAYLEYFLNVSFHPSDPSDYYYETKDISFSDVLHIESSNLFYFIINWYYNQIYSNATLISLLLKFNNVFVILISYLLITRKLEKVSFIDYLILFNPYLLVTIIRNVRDPYIILFTTIILIGLGVYENVSIKKIYIYISLLLLSITRSILLLPLFFIWTLKLDKRVRYLIYSSSLVMCIIFYDAIIQTITGQTISALNAIGEDITDFLPLLHGEYSISILMPLFIRLFVGLISMVFTPHPINYFTNWIHEMHDYGCYNIYTGIDNLLIFIGSIYTYIFVIPILFYIVFNWKKVNSKLVYFVVSFIILYVIAYIGVTDIRNRHLIFFFVLSSLLFRPEIKSLSLYNVRNILLTFIFFVCIYFLKS